MSSRKKMNFIPLEVMQAINQSTKAAPIQY